MKLRLFGRKGHKIYELENKHCSKVTKLCRKFRANGFGTSVMGDDYILVFNQDYPASVLMLIRQLCSWSGISVSLLLQLCPSLLWCALILKKTTGVVVLLLCSCSAYALLLFVHESMRTALSAHTVCLICKIKTLAVINTSTFHHFTFLLYISI